MPYVYMGTPHLSLQRQSYDMADEDDSDTAWGDSEREDELSVVSPEFPLRLGDHRLRS